MRPAATKQEREFWNAFALCMLEPFKTTIRKVVLRMLFDYPIRRLPPELARIARPLRAARREFSPRKKRRYS